MIKISVKSEKSSSVSLNFQICDFAQHCILSVTHMNKLLKPSWMCTDITLTATLYNVQLEWRTTRITVIIIIITCIY